MKPLNEMRPHEQRVVQEKEELDVKLKALRLFIESSPIFGNLSYREQSRLKYQADIMQRYSDVLGERIEAF